MQTLPWISTAQYSACQAAPQRPTPPFGYSLTVLGQDLSSRYTTPKPPSLCLEADADNNNTARRALQRKSLNLPLQLLSAFFGLSCGTHKPGYSHSCSA
jgi:hypothetical protein